MAVVIEFTSKTVLTVPAGSKPLDLWTYSIDPGAIPNLFVGKRIALAFPSTLDIQDPTGFPAVPDLLGMFLERTSGSSRLYVGKSVTTAGKQVIALVAPKGSALAEVLLVAASAGNPWDTTLFSISAAAGAELSQVLLAPVPITVPPASSQPLGDFFGTLPYASEIFGVYQPLAGWLGRRTMESTPDIRNDNRDPNRTSEFLMQRLRRFAGPRNDIPAADLFASDGARLARDPLFQAAIKEFQGTSKAVLSPIGLVTLFREYFFEFDNFLGVPSGHIWISPGGTVEVVESSTRRTLIERTAQQSEEGTYKVEESLTDQDDIADAIKEDNANDTKLGASASGGVNFAGIYHGDANASFSNESTIKKSSEITHKHTRNQSSKVSSEIHRNFQTTFKTVTETTDVTSRRYVVQNTSNNLINYELRRKMRKVGVQVQHIGTRLSWQVYLDVPGKSLGLGELVHVVEAPDLSFLKKPEEPPALQNIETQFLAPFILQKYPGTANDPHQDFNYTRSGEAPAGGITGMHSDDNSDHVVGDFEYDAPPPASGYTIDGWPQGIRLLSAKVNGGTAQFLAEFSWLTGSTGHFKIKARFLNFGGGRNIDVTVAINWKPPAIDPAQAIYIAKLNNYNAEVAELQRKGFAEAVRSRVKLVSRMNRRRSEDLRKEERHTIYGKLIHELQLFTDPHIDSELIRQLFDVDEMLYFAAPDYWRPAPIATPDPTQSSVGKYPVPSVPPMKATVPTDALEGGSVVSWYSHTNSNNALSPTGAASLEWRVNYVLTEDTEPAPFGSSLGWLIQIDGDNRRNEFINAAWVKAILPIRPGHELQALEWLVQAKVEGVGGLGMLYPMQPGDPVSYQGKTVDEVLHLLAAELQISNTDMNKTLATERVFETGFDPLEGGFRPAEPYEIFDQWIEVLPTDQVVAVQVEYNSKTGKLI